MRKLLLLLPGILAFLRADAQSLSSTIVLNGQPQCVFNELLQNAGLTYDQLATAYRQNPVPTGAAQKGNGVVFDIPVVFHIVYNPAQPTFNLPDSVILNQLDIINKAFRKEHGDTGKTRAIFKPLAADAGIQFHLATVDPTGAPTTGITRTESSLTHFGSTTINFDSMERVKSATDGGIDPWPPNRYLNIWVCNLANHQGQIGVLGFGMPPLNPAPPNWPSGTSSQLSRYKDGVVIQLHAVGSNNPIGGIVGDYYTRGRALVHEIGHYLGLQHEFGGNNGSSAFCGMPITSDGIGDTPEQSSMSFTPGGVPSPVKNTCGSGPNDSVDMWEDYMDYTVDSFQTLFTKGQADLMRSVLGYQRLGLVSPLSVTGGAILPAIAVYPNPATSSVNISYQGRINRLFIIDCFGQKRMELSGTNANAKSYDLSNFAPGVYLLFAEDDDGQRFAGKFSIVK